MASVNLSLAVVVAPFSGAVVGDDECGYEFASFCEKYVTCDNYPDQEFPGCNCLCRPTDGHGCVIHLVDGSGAEDCDN